jgi:septum formation protein
MSFLYLASQSPRRGQLLEQISIPYQRLVGDQDEDVESLEAVLPDENPEHYVQRVTLAKLHAAGQRLKKRGLSPAPILSADTTVALGQRILGKPVDAQDAFQTLTALSGQTHRVLTAVALSWNSQQTVTLSCSQVQFAKLERSTIERYIASQEPFGKAGAYAIQGQAAAWVCRIEGSYSGIMGLPLFETYQLLKQAKVFFEVPLCKTF